MADEYRRDGPKQLLDGHKDVILAWTGGGKSMAFERTVIHWLFVKLDARRN